MKILVVDDVMTNIVLLQNYLAELGDIDSAQDGKTASSLFNEAVESGEPYDLVCLDIMMPVYDGHWTLMAMRAIEAKQAIPKEKQAKIIMITALANQKDVVRALQDGCDSYLAKPIKKSVLFERLEQLKLINK